MQPSKSGLLEALELKVGERIQLKMEQEFSEIMVSHGVVCKEAIIAAGELHRFTSGGRGHKDAWYPHN